MSTLNANVALRATVTETFATAELPSASTRTLTHDKFNVLKSLGASSTPPATKYYSGLLVGPQSLDLTALVKDVGGTIDCTGLKLQVLLLNNLSTTDNVTMADSGAGVSSSGTSGNYSINGGAPLTIEPGASALLFFNDALDDVDAANCLLTIDAADAEKFEIAMIFG